MAWAAIDPGDGQPGGDKLAVGCSRSEYGLCEQVPGMTFSKKDAIWRVPLTWQAWVAFRTAWGSQPHTISPGLAEWADEQWNIVQSQLDLRKFTDVPVSERADALLDKFDAASPGRSLFGPQRAGAFWLWYMKRAMLEDPQGNGKTPQAIRAMQLQHHYGKGPFLVVCRGAAARNWAREVSLWAPELEPYVAAGTATARRRVIEHFKSAGKSGVLIVPWPDLRLHTRLAAYPGQEFVRCDEHGGSTGKSAVQCEVHDKELNEFEFHTVIVDEAHRMKDARSKQTRAVWHLAHRAECFWPLTGTPVADETVDDVWPIMHGLNKKAFPSRSKWLDMYAEKNYQWHGGTEILGIRPDNARAFHISVQPWVRRIPKEVMRPGMPPRLPPVIYTTEMTPAQRTLYRQLQKSMLAELESTTVVPKNTAVQFGRLCQLSASMIETKDGEDERGFTRQLVRMTAPSQKSAALLEFLEDNPGPLVVYLNSPQLLAICGAKLDEHKIPWVKVAGGMTYEQHDQAAQDFQAGRARVCFITTAGTESITLTAADTIAFLQPNPSFLVTDQAIGRVDRIGQVNPVRVVYFITPGVEERMFELSQEKAERANQMTEWGREQWTWMLSEAAGS